MPERPCNSSSNFALKSRQSLTCPTPFHLHSSESLKDLKTSVKSPSKNEDFDKPTFVLDNVSESSTISMDLNNSSGKDRKHQTDSLNGAKQNDYKFPNLIQEENSKGLCLGKVICPRDKRVSNEGHSSKDSSNISSEMDLILEQVKRKISRNSVDNKIDNEMFSPPSSPEVLLHIRGPNSLGNLKQVSGNEQRVSKMKLSGPRNKRLSVPCTRTKDLVTNTPSEQNEPINLSKTKDDCFVSKKTRSLRSSKEHSILPKPTNSIANTLPKSTGTLLDRKSKSSKRMKMSLHSSKYRKFLKGNLKQDTPRVPSRIRSKNQCTDGLKSSAARYIYKEMLTKKNDSPSVYLEQREEPVFNLVICPFCKKTLWGTQHYAEHLRLEHCINNPESIENHGRTSSKLNLVKIQMPVTPVPKRPKPIKSTYSYESYEQLKQHKLNSETLIEKVTSAEIHLNSETTLTQIDSVTKSKTLNISEEKKTIQQMIIGHREIIENGLKKRYPVFRNSPINIPHVNQEKSNGAMIPLSTMRNRMLPPGPLKTVPNKDVICHPHLYKNLSTCPPPVPPLTNSSNTRLPMPFIKPKPASPFTKVPNKTFNEGQLNSSRLANNPSSSRITSIIQQMLALGPQNIHSNIHNQSGNNQACVVNNLNCFSQLPKLQPIKQNQMISETNAKLPIQNHKNASASDSIISSGTSMSKLRLVRPWENVKKIKRTCPQPANEMIHNSDNLIPLKKRRIVLYDNDTKDLK